MLTAESWHGPLAFRDDARRFDGGVAEWLNAAVSKTVSGVKPLTRVRIPPPPLTPAEPMREVTTGVWHWKAAHPEWTPGQTWDRMVSSYAVDTGEAVLLFDPLDVPA